MSDPVRFRWLGVAGSEWSVDGRVLAIDPFFSRPPLRHMGFGRVQPNRQICVAAMPRCDIILVTHAHYDHLMDVPAIAGYSGAMVLGSPNTCALLEVMGVPEKQIRPISVGERIDDYPFIIQVLPGTHPRTPAARLLNGPLPRELHPPLRLRDYRMDIRFSFLLQMSGYAILCGDQPVPADVWLISPWESRAVYRSLLGAISPRVIIPIHWDNLFRPLYKGIRPTLVRRFWARRRQFRVHRHSSGQGIDAIASEARIVIPEVLRTYSLGDLFTTPDQPSQRISRKRWRYWGAGVS